MPSMYSDYHNDGWRQQRRKELQEIMTRMGVREEIIRTQAFQNFGISADGKVDLTHRFRVAVEVRKQRKGWNAYGLHTKDEQRERNKMRLKKQRVGLDQRYLKALIQQQTDMPLRCIPQSLVAAKRAHLRVTRKLSTEMQT